MAKVAIIGSGTAGLITAYTLVQFVNSCMVLPA